MKSYVYSLKSTSVRSAKQYPLGQYRRLPKFSAKRQSSDVKKPTEKVDIQQLKSLGRKRIHIALLTLTLAQFAPLTGWMLIVYAGLPNSLNAPIGLAAFALLLGGLTMLAKGVALTDRARIQEILTRQKEEVYFSNSQYKEYLKDMRQTGINYILGSILFFFARGLHIYFMDENSPSTAQLIIACVQRLFMVGALYCGCRGISLLILKSHMPPLKNCGR